MMKSSKFNDSMKLLSPEVINEPLCSKCKVLHFDDGRSGGYESVSKAGGPVLAFHNEERYSTIFERGYSHKDTLPHLPILRASAQNGCKFCHALWKATKTIKSDKSGSIMYKLVYLWKPINNPVHNPGYGLYALRADLTIIYDIPPACDSNEEKCSVYFTIESGRGNCAEWLQLLQAPSKQALCTENIEMIKTHMRVSVDSIQGPLEENFLPTRLLDLESPTGGIRLIETSDSPLNDPICYAALSYCWGSKADAAMQLKTEQHTLNERLIDIPFSSATPVVQDAVLVCRALSIRYLWIDALCIIQGDMDDWQKESGCMGLVYQNAYLTLCTLSTRSCLDSFLARAVPTEVSFQSTIRPDIYGTYNLRHYPIREDTAIRVPNVPYTMDALCGAWSNRGWTFQEEQLSRRMLLFGKSRLFLLIDGGMTIEPGIDDPSSSLLTLTNELQKLQLDMSNSNVDLYTTWLDIVSMYARRSLSHIEDRFPAVSGLAKYIADITGDSYVCGIWKRDCLRGLLWQNFHNDLSSSTCSEWMDTLQGSTDSNFICPSWSWARHKEMEYFPTFIFDKRLPPGKQAHGYQYNFRTECKQLSLESSVENSTLNPFGRIISHSLHILGRVKSPEDETFRSTGPATGYSSIKQWKLKFDGAGEVAICNLDFKSDNRDELVLEKVVMLLLASSRSGSGAGPNYKNHIEAEQDDVALQYERKLGFDAHLDYQGQMEQRQVDLLSQRNAWGLLLLPVKGNKKYVRIGRFNVKGGLRYFINLNFQMVQLI